MFIFNTGILLIDVNFIEGVVIFLAMTVGMLAFCSATQHFIFIRNRIWETLALLLVAFTMFRPDYWLDQIVPPLIEVEGRQVEALLDGEMAGAPENIEHAPYPHERA